MKACRGIALIIVSKFISTDLDIHHPWISRDSK